MKVDPAKLILKEAFVDSPESYARRVHLLAAFYSALFLICLFGLIVLIAKIKLYITLAQRSNVETLTIAFFALFFSYMGVISWPGAWGAIKMMSCLLAPGENGREAQERRKISLLKRQKNQVCVALDLAVTCDGREFTVPIEDEFGSLGTLHFDGARISHCDLYSDGSNTLFSFVVKMIEKIHEKRTGKPAKIKIVEWEKIDDEETAKYLRQVDFARRLQEHLGAKLWPEISLSSEDIEELKHCLKRTCPSLRSEALIPDWEYQGEHKIPVIPEPLGIISLSRQEKRVDPIASMGAVLAILFVSLIVFVIFVFFPPWVPGV
jgi:hypothetical protein